MGRRGEREGIGEGRGREWIGRGWIGKERGSGWERGGGEVNRRGEGERQ